MHADRHGAEDRRPEDRGLEDRGHRHSESRDVGLHRIPERAPGRAAADAHLVHANTGPEHRPGDVADRERRRLHDRPRDMSAAVTEGQAGENAARLWVPDRRALTGEIRQEHETIGAGRRRRCLVEERLHRDRPAEDRFAIPVERPARRCHRRADAVPSGERSRRHEPSGDLDRAIPVDPEPSRRPARVVRVAGLEETRSDIARERVDHAARDRDPRTKTEGVGGSVGQLADDRAGTTARRQPVDRHPGPGDERDVRDDLVRDERRDSHARQPEREPLPRGQIPAGRGRDGRLVPLDPQRRGQPAEGPATNTGRRLQLGGLLCVAGVEERDRRSRRLAARVDRSQRRTVPIDADRNDLCVLGSAERPNGADHGRPPRSGVLLRAAVPAGHVEAVAAAGERRASRRRGSPTRPWSRSFRDRCPGPPVADRSSWPSAGRRERDLIECHDCLGRRDVGDEGPDDARAKRAEDRPDLALARRDPDRDRDPCRAGGHRPR